MRTVTYLFIIILSCLAFNSCTRQIQLTTEEELWLEENDQITIALYPYYAPYQFLGQRGVDEGIFIDYLTLLESKIDHSFERKLYTNWTEILDDAQDKRIELILEVQPTQQKETYLNFYPIFYQSDFVIVSNKNNQEIQSLAQLAGTIVNLPEGFGARDLLLESVKNVDFQDCKSDGECLAILDAGSGDAYIGPESVANYHIKSLGLDHIKITGSINQSYNPSIAVIQGEPILNSIIAKASASISNAEKQALVEDWLFTYKQPYYKTYTFWVFLVCLLVLLTLLTFLFNKYLHKKIKQRRSLLMERKKHIEENTNIQLQFAKNANNRLATPLAALQHEIGKISSSPYTTGESEVTRKIIRLGNELIDQLDNALGVSDPDSRIYDPNENTKAFAEAVNNTSAEKRKLNVLIAEDDRINLLLLQQILLHSNDFDFKIYHAPNGKEAVEMSSRIDHLDLIFMDVKMPVMDGYEATDLIKVKFPGIPIIAQTAYSSPNDILNAMAAGCDGFLSKPIDQNKLELEMRKVLHLN